MVGPPSPPPGLPIAPPPLVYDLPGPPGSMGRLIVDVSGRMHAGRALYDYLPKVSINGAPLLVLRHGPTVINLPAGHHHLVVGVGSDNTDSFHYGRAHTTATVWPHQTTTVYYRAPWTTLSGGAIGPSPQQAPDRFLGLGLLVFAALAFVIGISALVVDWVT